MLPPKSKVQNHITYSTYTFMPTILLVKKLQLIKARSTWKTCRSKSHMHN